jgi:hypothetical protein
MNPDDLEQRMARQPRRPIPAEWREQILAAARQASGLAHTSRVMSHAPRWRTVVSSLNSQLSALLWPSPRAWAGLATVWIAILGVHLATRDAAPAPVAKQAAPPSRQLLQTLAEQKRLLAELLGPREMPAPVRPKPSPPRQRSEAGQENLPA